MGSPISDEVLSAEYEAVYRYILTLCRNEADAQDITQETFFKAIHTAERFRGESSLYTWLCAIGKNIWLNKCKRDNREHPEGELNAASGKSVEQWAVEKDLSLHIHRVLHGLNEPYKEVFSLRVFGQLSFGEIAGLFSRTESWARVTYHRARKMITEALRKEGML